MNGGSSRIGQWRKSSEQCRKVSKNKVEPVEGSLEVAEGRIGGSGTFQGRNIMN